MTPSLRTMPILEAVWQGAGYLLALPGGRQVFAHNRDEARLIASREATGSTVRFVDALRSGLEGGGLELGAERALNAFSGGEEGGRALPSSPTSPRATSRPRAGARAPRRPIAG